MVVPSIVKSHSSVAAINEADEARGEPRERAKAAVKQLQTQVYETYLQVRNVQTMAFASNTFRAENRHKSELYTRYLVCVYVQ